MQSFHTVPILTQVMMNQSGIEIDTGLDYSTNLMPTTAAAELVIEAYFIYVCFFA